MIDKTKAQTIFKNILREWVRRHGIAKLNPTTMKMLKIKKLLNGIGNASRRW